MTLSNLVLILSILVSPGLVFAGNKRTSPSTLRFENLQNFDAFASGFKPVDCTALLEAQDRSNPLSVPAASFKRATLKEKIKRLHQVAHAMDSESEPFQLASRLNLRASERQSLTMKLQILLQEPDKRIAPHVDELVVIAYKFRSLSVNDTLERAVYYSFLNALLRVYSPLPDQKRSKEENEKIAVLFALKAAATIQTLERDPYPDHVVQDALGQIILSAVHEQSGYHNGYILEPGLEVIKRTLESWSRFSPGAQARVKLDLLKFYTAWVAIYQSTRTLADQGDHVVSGAENRFRNVHAALESLLLIAAIQEFPTLKDSIQTAIQEFHRDNRSDQKSPN